MKIRMQDVKPGMVIKGKGRSGLVIKVEGGGQYIPGADLCDCGCSITVFDTEDSYYGPFCFRYRRKEKVKVLTGKARDGIIASIIRDQLERKADVERDLDTVLLIKSMGEI